MGKRAAGFMAYFPKRCDDALLTPDSQSQNFLSPVLLGPSNGYLLAICVLRRYDRLGQAAKSACDGKVQKQCHSNAFLNLPRMQDAANNRSMEDG